MDYKIIRATAETGQIDVAYLHEDAVVGVYAIDVPIVDGAFITGDELDAEIRHRAPLWLIDRKQSTAAATGFDAIVAAVEPTPPADPQEQANARMWASVEFEKKVAAALVKFGVLQSDPTVIPTTEL